MTDAVQPPPLPLRLLAVRWAASLHMIAVVAQAGFAMAFLAGLGEVYGLHRTNGWLVPILGLLQLLAAIANGVGRTGRWLTLAAAALFLLEAAQVWLGRRVLTDAHVLNALVVWSLAIFVLVKVWMPAWAEAQRAR